MASVSLIEGLAKKFLNLVPRPFYTEAAQKLVHEICETIYNETQVPRKEIIDIVIKFVNTHLGFNPENPGDNPVGIRDAILDSVSKTTLEVYKDDIINKLLLQKILLKEFDEKGKVTETGNFYKSLGQSINNANASGPNFNNSGGVDNKKNENGDTNKEEKKTDKDSEKFAKKVVNELVNTNVVNELVNTNVEITESKRPENNNIKGGASGILGVVGENISRFGSDFAAKNPLTAAAGMAISAAALSGSLKGKGSGNGGTTNIGYEPNDKGVLPYIQTNCNGSGLGLPGIDLDFLSGLLDGLKEPIAEELVKKIQERLPDKTMDSLTVKRDIYEKILLVIQAHLQSQQGKNMLLDTIKPMIDPEIKFLLQDIELEKRLIKVIFKNKSSEIYKKLIYIIAKNTTQDTPLQNTKDDKDSKCDDKPGKKTYVNGGAEQEKNDNNPDFTTNISNVIIEFNQFINGDVNKFNDFPEVKKSIKDAAIAEFQKALVEQQKKMEVDSKNNQENAKKANEEGIKKIALGLVNTKIDEIKQKEQTRNEKTLYVELLNGKEEVRPPIPPTENGGNLDHDTNTEPDNRQLNEVDKLHEQLNNESEEREKLKNILESKQGKTIKKTKEKLIKRTINNLAIKKVSEQIENKKSNLPPPPPRPPRPFKGGNSTKNKTKRRRTKNNTRKMKQKRRVTKKKNHQKT
jgi:hypothetical protein